MTVAGYTDKWLFSFTVVFYAYLFLCGHYVLG